VSRAIKIGEKEENGVNFRVMECYVGDDPEKNIKGERVEYSIPLRWEDFTQLSALAKTEPEQNRIMAAYEYGHGLKARSEARPGGGTVTLPEVMTAKYGKLNLVTGAFDGKVKQGKQPESPAKVQWANNPVALKDRARYINAAYDKAETEGKVPSRGIQLARAELLAAKQVKETEMGLVPMASK
jgi:hypothetical protein